MSQRVVMVMLCAWLFAGVLDAAERVRLRGGVGVGGAALALTGGAYVACGVSGLCARLHATGTSFGTILVAGPLLYPAGGPLPAPSPRC